MAKQMRFASGEIGSDHPNPRSTLDFRSEAAGILRRLAEAFSAATEALPQQVRRASELARALGIDGVLTWNILQVVNATDPFAAVKHIPKPAALEKFLKGAGRAGVPVERIAAIRAAADDFVRLQHTHADDRAALNAMLAGCSAEGDARGMLTQKRAAFRANRYLYGLQARTAVTAQFLQPSGIPGSLDAAFLGGHVGLRWLRPSARWLLRRPRIRDDDGQVRQSVRWEALTPDADADGVPLLRAFCSQPLPHFQRVDLAPGAVRDELISNGLGNTASVTYFTGEVVRGVGGLVRDEYNDYGSAGTFVEVPTEVLVLDLLVREDTFGPIRPEVSVCRPPRDMGPVYCEADELHLDESATYVGKGLDRAFPPDVPRCAELYRYVLDVLRWDASRFEIYRCRVEYPVVPSGIFIRFPLPERPFAGR